MRLMEPARSEFGSTWRGPWPGPLPSTTLETLSRQQDCLTPRLASVGLGSRAMGQAGKLTNGLPVLHSHILVDFGSWGSVEAVASRLFGPADPILLAGFDVVVIGLVAAFETLERPSPPSAEFSPIWRR
jgi:hypothetical protein